MKDRVFEAREPLGFCGKGAPGPKDDSIGAGALLVLNGTPEECRFVEQQTGRDVWPIAPDWLAAVCSKVEPYEVLQ